MNCKYCSHPVVLKPSAKERANRYGGKASDYTKLFPVHPACLVVERSAQSRELATLHSIAESDMALLIRLSMTDHEGLDKALGVSIGSAEWTEAVDRLNRLQSGLRVPVKALDEAASLMLSKIAAFRGTPEGNSTCG